jgi:small-conductance mechanosensitive channel
MRFPRTAIPALTIFSALFLSAIFLAEAQTPSIKPADPKSVISFLNQSVAWYRNLPAEQQLASDSTDAAFLNDDRQLADQIIRLSFDFALADADLQSRLSAQAVATSAQTDADTQSTYRSEMDLAAQADQQVKELEGEVANFKLQLATATAANRPRFQSLLEETQSELDLAKTRRDVLQNMVQFVGGIGSGSKVAPSLRAQIAELQRAVPAAVSPAVASASSQSSQPAAPSAPPEVYAARKPASAGIFGLIADVISLHRKMASLDGAIQLCATLAETSKSLGAPFNTEIQELVKRGDVIADQADTSNAAGLLQEKQDLDALTREFKQASDIVLPLGKQVILLDLYKSNLTNWRDSVHAVYWSEFKSLLYSLGTLALFIIVTVGLSDLWRRITFRYIREPRRRYQYLLASRITMWIVIAIIVAIAFASQLGSLATFAGLLTAGIALALQNVILSFAGYFFLIGKYGVRVGDRVQISSVTGEVVDIGLIRMHLAELSSAESDAQPTGRVVGFSNSVVFEAGKGFFKQIPETSFTWHQITLILAAESNYKEVEERLMGAVNSVLADYKEAMEQQRSHMEQSFAMMSVKSFDLQSRLRLTQTGLEVVIRYPLDLEKASEIDDRITRSLLDAMDRAPKIKLVGTATPNLQPIIPSSTTPPPTPPPPQS